MKGSKRMVPLEEVRARLLTIITPEMALGETTEERERYGEKGGRLRQAW